MSVANKYPPLQPDDHYARLSSAPCPSACVCWLQVLSSCLDVRQCYFMSVFLLRHLMHNQQARYWRALRHLFLQAQQLNDERLLQNPYLQVGVLLGMQ